MDSNDKSQRLTVSAARNCGLRTLQMLANLYQLALLRLILNSDFDWSCF